MNSILKCHIASLALILVYGCGAPPPVETKLAASPRLGSEAVTTPEILPPKETAQEETFRLVQEATDRCREAALPVEYFQVKGNRLLARPVALCAWSRYTKTWHTIIVRIPFFSKADWSRPREWRESQFTIDVLSPGPYLVSRVSGSGFGPSRLAFDVSFHGEHLVVYRARHVWFGRTAFESGDAERMLASYELIDLTPLHPDFYGMGLSEVAVGWLYGEIAAIYEELDRLSVSSQAFPLKRITEVIPPTLLLSIPIIEHIDQETYMGTTTCNKEPTCVAEAQRRAIEGALIVYALNRDAGNRFSVSSSGAVGAWQFMNSKQNPTYDSVSRICAAARISPDYPEGAKQFRNAGKAAICLLDLNLRYLPETHDLFRRNPVLGGIYLLAAYNGGPRSAKALFREVHLKHPDVEAEDIILPSVLRITKGTMKKTIRHGPRKQTSYTALATRLNGETPGYAHKFLTLLEYLAAQEGARE